MYKKIFIALTALFVLTSCKTSSFKTTTVKDEKEVIEITKNEHPKIYTMYKNGDVVVIEAYKRHDKKTKEYMGSRLLIGRGK